MPLAPDLLLELPDYQAWRSSGRDIDLFDYLKFVATPDLLFAFMELLRPELRLHDGNYFLASKFDPATYDDWMSRLGDPVGVQKVMNHQHLTSIFQGQRVSDPLAVEAGRRIAAFWSEAFDDIGLVGEVFGETFEDLEVTFFRKTPPAGSDR